MSPGRPDVAVLHALTLPPGLEAIAGTAALHPTRGDDLERVLRTCGILFVWDFFWEGPRDELRRAWPADTSVRWVHLANVGLDRLLFPALARSGVVVTNSAGVYEHRMAEYVLGLLLAMSRRLPEMLARQRRREWLRDEGTLLRGSRALVVGAGPIGREIARLLTCVGMRVDLVGRTARADAEFGAVRAVAELTELLPVADAVVLAAPLTGETRHLFGLEQFAAMRDSAFLVNVGRGALLDEGALLRALCDGMIAGAALDVFETEPLPRESPLWEAPHLIVSEHRSAVTTGWREDLAKVFYANLARWRAGEPLANVVPAAMHAIG